MNENVWKLDLDCISLEAFFELCLKNQKQTIFGKTFEMLTDVIAFTGSSKFYVEYVEILVFNTFYLNIFLIFWLFSDQSADDDENRYVFGSSSGRSDLTDALYST